MTIESFFVDTKAFEKLVEWYKYRMGCTKVEHVFCFGLVQKEIILHLNRASQKIFFW